jgi:hypothetical protein
MVRTAKGERQLILSWIIPVGLLVLWQLLASRPHAGRALIPAPREILEAGARLVRSGELAHHAWVQPTAGKCHKTDWKHGERLVPRDRVELSTHGFSVRCSTS